MSEATQTNGVPAIRDEIVEGLLTGAIDLHCHSGPSVMPRRIDHIEALKEASAVGMKAILFKDHYYSVAPVTELLTKHYAYLGVKVLSGVPLNNTVGGINRYAVEHGIKLGARLVWMPTFSSANHLRHSIEGHNFDNKFPRTKGIMLAPTPLSPLDSRGDILEEVKVILDLIAESDIVLSAGHLHISEIWPLFEEAKLRGVKRLLVNHPNFVVDASIADIRGLVDLGAYVEHSVCMYVEGSHFKFYEPNTLRELISAGTVDRTILGSDLGQIGNPRPVEGFRAVIRMCLEIGFTPAEVTKMISVNPSQLMGLDLP